MKSNQCPNPLSPESKPVRLPETWPHVIRSSGVLGKIYKNKGHVRGENFPTFLLSFHTGAGIPHFTGQSLAKMTFPLPPLAEQQRIVAKVDELLRWCDALEARPTAGQTSSATLLSATLHQILGRQL
jgi:hypothetical protein